jgi:hypothetical protein
MLQFFYVISAIISAVSLAKFGTPIQINSTPITRRKILTIALTRERAKNDKLKTLLPSFHCVNFPCVEFSLNERISVDDIKKCDLVVLTSPQVSSSTLFVSHHLSLGCIGFLQFLDRMWETAYSSNIFTQ